MALVQCDNINFSYDGKRQILNDVSFSIEKGQLVTLLGPNGVGKSTLLNCITGLLKPQGGKVLLDGKDIFSLSRKSIARKIAYVPQKNAVPFDYLVKEFVVMGRTAHLGILTTPSEQDYKLVNDALLKLGITDLAERQINELSGGEQQRVSIARAIAKNPKLLLCDEPTGALDYATGKNILRLLHDVCKQNKKLVIVVTHNQALKDMADKVITIKNGRIERVYNNEQPKPIEEIEW